MSPTGPRRAGVGTWITLFVLGLALYFLLVASGTLVELAAGSAMSAMAATLGLVVLRGAGVSLGPRRTWLAEIAGLPGAIVRDTGIVLMATARQLTGRAPGSGFREIDLSAAQRDRVVDRGFTAIVRSVAPNTIVLRLDPDGGKLLVHHLVAPRGKDAGRTARPPKTRGKRS